MTVLAEDWQCRASELARRLVAAGKLWSAPWQAAVCAVPRHELVPDLLRRDPDGSWHRLDTTTAQGQRDWLEQVYSNKALLTAAADCPGPRSLRSSSSMPGLMTRMLEALDVHAGHRVLEPISWNWPERDSPGSVVRWSGPDPTDNPTLRPPRPPDHPRRRYCSNASRARAETVLPSRSEASTAGRCS